MSRLKFWPDASKIEVLAQRCFGNIPIIPHTHTNPHTNPHTQFEQHNTMSEHKDEKKLGEVPELLEDMAERWHDEIQSASETGDNKAVKVAYEKVQKEAAALPQTTLVSSMATMVRFYALAPFPDPLYSPFHLAVTGEHKPVLAWSPTVGVSRCTIFGKELPTSTNMAFHVVLNAPPTPVVAGEPHVMDHTQLPSDPVILEHFYGNVPGRVSSPKTLLNPCPELYKFPLQVQWHIHVGGKEVQKAQMSVDVPVPEAAFGKYDSENESWDGSEEHFVTCEVSVRREHMAAVRLALAGRIMPVQLPSVGSPEPTKEEWVLLWRTKVQFQCNAVYHNMNRCAPCEGRYFLKEEEA